MKKIKIFLCTILAMVASSVMAQPLSAGQVIARAGGEGTVLYEIDDNYDKKSLIDYGNVVVYTNFMKTLGQLYGDELTAEFDGDQPGSKLTKIARHSIYGASDGGTEDETRYWKNYTKEKFIAFCKDDMGIKDGDDDDEGFPEIEDMEYLTRIDEVGDKIILSFSGTSKSTGMWAKGTITAEFDSNGKCTKCYEEATSNVEGYETFYVDMTEGFAGMSKFYIRYMFGEMFDSVGELDAIETVANSTAVKGIYNVDGKKVSSFLKGISIVRYSDGTVRKVMVK